MVCCSVLKVCGENVFINGSDVVVTKQSVMRHVFICISQAGQMHQQIIMFVRVGYSLRLTRRGLQCIIISY